MKKDMITAEMIAPCGLDCSLCKRAQAEENPCPGCHGPDETDEGQSSILSTSRLRCWTDR